MRQTLGWVAAGAAALFVAGGFAAYAVRESDVAIWNDPNRCLNVNPIQTRAENCGDHQSNFQTAEALIIAGFVGGGALALTSALLLTLRSGKEARHAGLACGPGPGTAGIACGGSF